MTSLFSRLALPSSTVDTLNRKHRPRGNIETPDASFECYVLVQIVRQRSVQCISLMQPVRFLSCKFHLPLLIYTQSVNLFGTNILNHSSKFLPPLCAFQKRLRNRIILNFPPLLPGRISQVVQLSIRHWSMIRR